MFFRKYLPNSTKIEFLLSLNQNLHQQVHKNQTLYKGQNYLISRRESASCRGSAQKGRSCQDRRSCMSRGSWNLAEWPASDPAGASDPSEVVKCRSGRSLILVAFWSMTPDQPMLASRLPKQIFTSRIKCFKFGWAAICEKCPSGLRVSHLTVCCFPFLFRARAVVNADLVGSHLQGNIWG